MKYKKAKTKSVVMNEISENHLLIENVKKSWTVDSSEGALEVGIYVEILDMMEATGEPEFKDYPVSVSFSLVSLNPSIDHNESDDKNPDRESLIFDCYQYRGGVPLDHFIQDLSDKLLSGLKVTEACLKTNKAEFGTIAAQRGKGASFTYPMFKDETAALKYIKKVLKLDLDNLDFDAICEEPINMVGDLGLDTIVEAVNYGK